MNHDVLMGRLAKRIADTRMLRLIRCYLEAGLMAHGVVIERHEGTPQGGPLSPLLANVLLDDVDQVLEKRGHAFVRYADDCNVYVRSPKAGARVLACLRGQYARLRLRINEEKSTVARVITRQFLGIAFWRGPGGRVRRRVADQALEAMKDRVREITGRSRGRSIAQVVAELKPYLTGWHAYFRVAETPLVFRRLDEWIRHRLRQVYLKQWKRGPTIYRELRARGASDALARSVAFGATRWWHHASLRIHQVLTNAHFDHLGVPRLAPSPQRLEPPDADPHVRWCGRSRKATIPISIADFTRWLVALEQGKLISRQSLQELWGPATFGDGTAYSGPNPFWSSCGLGWTLNLRPMHPRVGGTGGLRAGFAIYPNNHLSVIVLTNLQTAAPDSLVDGIAALYLK